MPKPIKLDLPYPTTEGIEQDCKTARILAPAYAGGHSELNAILQYVYHFLNFEGAYDKKTAQTLMGIALAEMEHLEILGVVLTKLGADPVFTHFPPCKTDFYTTRAVSYSKTPIKMLLDDISGEMVAISEYKKINGYIDNEKVSAIISRIILDEELHVTILKDLVKKYMGD